MSRSFRTIFRDHLYCACYSYKILKIHRIVYCCMIKFVLLIKYKLYMKIFLSVLLVVKRR